MTNKTILFRGGTGILTKNNMYLTQQTWILLYLCIKFAALGNLKVSFHCAGWQHLYKK